MPAEETLEVTPVSFRKLFRFASLGDILCILLGTMFAVFGGAIQPMVLILGGLITSVYLQPIEKIGNDKFWFDVMHLIKWLGITGFMSFFTTYLQSYLLHRGCMNIVHTLREEFMRAILRQDSTWFDLTHSGAVTTQLNDNVERIHDGLGDKIGLLARGFSMFIFSVSICCVISWRITLITLTMGPVSAMTLAFMSKMVAGYMKKQMDSASKAASIFEEAVMNVRTVAACNGQQQFVKKYECTLANSLKYALRYHFWIGFSEGLTFLQIYVIIGVALWYGVYSYFNGLMNNRGDVILCVNTISLTAYYLGTLGPHMMAILKARVAAAVIYETIDRSPLVNYNLDGLSLESPQGHIVFSNINFTYPTRQQPVLQDLTWEAKPGEMIALVGHSGCGKSTSISLLTRMYEANSGNLMFDGICIKDINLRSLRRNIGVVQQEPYLFNGTVLENIILGRTEITEEQAKRAAQIANAHEFIMKLERGYDTILSSEKIDISGGQKQRIAIARAIANNPRVLLLDEATSALDVESERILQAALTKASKGRTTILIAHRLSTLKYVNRIYVMDKGHVCEVGTHSELIRKNGLYANLVKAQHIIQVQAATKHEKKTSFSPKTSVIKTSNQSSSRINMELTRVDSKMDKVKWRGGLLLLYRNLKGNYITFFLALFSSFIRGSELPLLGVSFLLTFEALQMDSENYQAAARNSLLVSIGSGFVIWISLCCQTFFAGWTAERTVDSLRARAFRNVLHRDMGSFDCPGSSPAACIAILAQHATNCNAGLDYRLATITSNLFSAILGLAISYSFSWQLGLLGTGLSLSLCGLTFINIYMIHQCHKKKERDDQSAEYAIEIVEQAQNIQLLTVEEHFLQKYIKQQNKSSAYDTRIRLVESFNFAITQSFVFLCDLSCYILGTYLIYNGIYSTEMTFFAFLGAQFSGWSVMYSSPYFPELIKAAGSANALFCLINEQNKEDRIRTEGIKPEISGDISLYQVKFSYPLRPSICVAKNLTLTIQKGESVALVGQSGCGKSTIINLLERFYLANSGEVKFTSYNVNNINLHHLRQNIALVEQEPVLFNGSIMDNVLLGANDATKEDAIRACATAHAQKFIEGFPLSYDTDVGERGQALSGGQKQRIAIARAIVRNPRILLLDEATSALDTESEAIIQRALNEASFSRTCIIITHRLTSIFNTDRIYYIEGGSVVESGSHADLMANGGKYAKLVQNIE